MGNASGEIPKEFSGRTASVRHCFTPSRQSSSIAAIPPKVIRRCGSLVPPTSPPKQYSAPIDRVRRKRQRLPSSLLIENASADAYVFASILARRGISDEG